MYRLSAPKTVIVWVRTPWYSKSQEHLHPELGVRKVRDAPKGRGVLLAHHGADPDLVGEVVGVERRRGEEPHHVEGVGPGGAYRVEDLRTDPLDHRGHRHHRGDPDHDAEDRQRRPELVGAHGGERQCDSLGKGVEHGYSARNAVIGSSRAAREAG